MEKIGLICEYNPFHNGHLYHIDKIKELYPDSILILVMSGYFTERGEISLISKYNKVKIALKYGIDIVIELPVLFGVNSGDYFATSCIKSLNALGVKKIIFGSECNDIKLLKKIARKQICNMNFDIEVKEELDKGTNYPTALAKACGVSLNSNDLLGVSYIKTILENKYDIEPVTIKRTNSFTDISSNEEIISALNIRERFNKGENISKYIPDYDVKFINKIDYNKLFELLKYKIITSNNLDVYLGVDEGLSNKLKKEIGLASSMDDLIMRIKSKRYTYVRLQRMLIHILLGIKKEDININKSYERILGFSNIGQKYLKELDSKDILYKYDNRIYEIEKRAFYIYSLVTQDESVSLEVLNKPIIKEDF